MDPLSRRLLAAARQQGNRVPDDADTAMASLWLASQAPDGPPGISRYLLALWHERVDLQEAYPGLFLDPDQRDEYLRWALAFGATETQAPTEVLAVPEPPQRTPRDGPVARGVTVVGFFRAVLGIGAAARRLADLVELAGEPVHRRDYDHTSSPRTVPFVDTDGFGEATPRHDIEIFAVNGAQTRRAVRAIGPRRNPPLPYRIGQWFWELDLLPEDQREGFDHLDELWVSSPFVRDAVLAGAPSGFPVKVIPLGADIGVASASDVERVRQMLGIGSSRHTLGFAFDHQSRLARKNPLGLVEAYRRAVPRPDRSRVQLLIKTIGAADFPDQHRRLLEATGGRPDIIILDAVLDDADQHAFLVGLDAYVSLHRSEGYGLPLLEAMARGVPVVATGHSGNLAFMDESTTLLVPCALVPVTSTEGTDGLYASVPSARWAEPLQDDAAAAIAQVIEELETESAALHARIARARAIAQPLVDGAAGAAWIANRLAEIRCGTPS